MNDHTLADNETPDPGPFGDPNSDTPPAFTQMSIEDVLASARRVEKVSRICLRGDLQARHDEIIAELSRLVSPTGELIADDDASLGEESAAARAQALSTELDQLRRQMAGAMWAVRFRAMPTDEWAVFVKKHMPRGEEPDLTDFHIRIIAETAISPELTVEQVTKLRSVLGSSQFMRLANDAYKACTTGGLDVPKSPVSLRNLTAQ